MPSSTRYFLNAWQGIKRRTASLRLGQPLFLRSAHGATFRSHSGKKYIDFLMGWGTVLYGHNNASLLRVMRQSLNDGLTSTIHHPRESELAEKIVRHQSVPSKVAFFNNGTDATTAAVRIARKATKKERIIFTGYHGWSDWFQPESPGVPSVFHNALSQKIPADPPEKLIHAITQHAKTLAAVVIEIPLRLTSGPEIIREVKRLSRQHRFCVLFDEVKSAPRLGLTPGRHLYGVSPDMAIFGKAFGGGLPFAALAVRSSLALATKDLFLSGTTWGLPVALAVAKYIVDDWEKHQRRETLHSLSKYFVDRANSLFVERSIGLSLDQYYPMPVLQTAESPRVVDRFYKHAFQQGLFIRPRHCLFLSLAHTRPVLDIALEKITLILRRL